MKLIMENWRRHTGEYDFDILCENHTRGLITDLQLVETWERQMLLEMDLLVEAGIMDILAQGYEKAQQLTGRAKEMYNAALQKLSEWSLNLCLQAWSLIQKVKEGVQQVASVLMKAYNAVKKFCNAHPILCKVVKFLLIMITIAAVMALFSSQAQAAVGTGGMPGAAGENAELSDRGVEAIKGMLHGWSDDKDPEIQQRAADAVKWLQEAHSSETVVDLSTATEKGAREVRVAYQAIQKMAQEDPKVVGDLANLGEKVFIKSKEITETLYGSGISSKSTHIEWESLGALK